MTREDAIKGLKVLRKDLIKILRKDFSGYKPNEEMFDMAIKALEQDPILDKIRAEIEQTTSRYCISRERGGSGQVEWSDRLIKESEVLEILDKYKSESEE